MIHKGYFPYLKINPSRSKWIYNNKLHENGKVVRNKVRLVVQGYLQLGIDLTETFALVARLEVIHMLLSFTTHNDMRLHQMDVNSEFLNDIINEEFYLKKVLHGLKQAHPTLYEKLGYFIMENGFSKGKVDTCKNYYSHFIIVQIYVDDIIFCATDGSLCKEFYKLM
ncbi:Copia protein, partial [Mucuna pruriens]